MGKRKQLLKGIFFVYILVMLWLLFARHHFYSGIGYWDDVRKNFNGTFLYSIKQYLRILFLGANPDYYRYAFINFFGNIVLFVPAGFLCPLIWKKARNLLRFLPLFMASIVLVEVLQLFTLRGSCDVDDLFLNTLGALLGWIFWRKISLDQRKKKTRGKGKKATA